jgi:site-specific recombinase XerD
MKVACTRLGISENASPHSARKTFAVDLFREKGLPAVQKALQHDRPETTKIYAFSDKNVENYVENSQNFDFEGFAELVAEKVYKKIKEEYAN